MVKIDNNVCPVCGIEGRVEGFGVYVEHNHCIQECTCNRCGSFWEDSYTITEQRVTERNNRLKQLCDEAVEEITAKLEEYKE